MLVGILVAAVGIIALVYALTPAGPAPSSSAPAAASQSGPNLAYATARTGHVTDVFDAESARVVTTDGVRDVRIIGVAPPLGEQCGATIALARTRTLLLGQDVTLVPDPSLKQSRDEYGHDRYAVVLRSSQLSVTDDLLQGGYARWDGQDSWYSHIYVDEENHAKDAQKGVWGEPCTTSN